MGLIPISITEGNILLIVKYKISMNPGIFLLSIKIKSSLKKKNAHEKIITDNAKLAKIHKRY